MINALRRLCSAHWYSITSPDYRLLKRSRFFDDAYYLRTNPDLQGSAYDPLAHYLTRGFQELRRPGPFFDHHFYMQQCPEIQQERDNPLLHFLTKGRYQGLVPNPLVDPHWYIKTLGENRPALPDPLSHFLSQQKTANPPPSPSPYFDPAFYGQCYEDARPLAGQAEAAYRHFLEYGQKTHRRPSSYFDSDYYLDKAPGLREQGYDALTHYALFGRREGKSPSPLFDPLFYKERYQPADNLDPFAHYLCRQDDLEVRPCSWFDPGFYRRTYLHEDPTPALKHFLEKGLRQGFYPNGDIAGLAAKPLISVVLPVYNVAAAHLNTCIRSVLFQSYPHWQLCLADDCSSDPDIRPLLRRWLGEDPRIAAVFLDHNSGISAATNAAASLANGEYLLFLDHDDELAPEAMAIFAERINKDPADLYYSDEDLIGADGRQFSIFRKPGFNPELLLCHNYITHCVVTKKALYETVGGCDSAYDGAQDLDLFLKLSERADKVVHIPEILYHWRASEKSTSINHQEKHYADDAGRNCVAAALARRGINGEVLGCEWKFFYRAKRAVPNALSITVVFDWDLPEALPYATIANLLAKSGYPVSQLLVHAVDDQATANLSTLPFPQLCEQPVFASFPKKSSRAERLATALPEISGEIVVVIDGRLNLECDGWLLALLEYGQSYKTGVVYGQIATQPEEELSEITPIPDVENDDPLYYSGFISNSSVLMNGRQCSQQVLGMEGQLFLVRRRWLEEEFLLSAKEFPLHYAFLDLSYRLHHVGKENIYTPYCRAMAQPGSKAPLSSQRWQDLTQETHNFQMKWCNLPQSGDPFYNRKIIDDAGGSSKVFEQWYQESRRYSSQDPKGEESDRLVL